MHQKPYKTTCSSEEIVLQSSRGVLEKCCFIGRDPWKSPI